MFKNRKTKFRVRIATIIMLLLFINLIDRNFIVLTASNNFILKNSSFEEVENDNSGHWEGGLAPSAWTEVWKPVGDPTVKVTKDEARSGERSVKISAVKKGRASVTQEILIEDNELYVLSGWIKTSKVTSKHGARLRIVSFRGEERVPNITYSDKVIGTTDWTYVELTFNPEVGVDRVRVQLFLEEGTGTAWFDDVIFKNIPKDLENDSVISFESGIPEAFSVNGDSEISISNKRYQDGNSSLQWKYNSGDQLIINTSMEYKNNNDTFAIWIYNEQPVSDYLLFEFSDGHRIVAKFPFNMNFEGWRTAWIPFRDMDEAKKGKMDRLTITAPAYNEGTLFLDQIVLSTPVDTRHPTRDGTSSFCES